MDAGDAAPARIAQMNQRVVEAINRQINSELSASYSYLAMSAWCDCQKFTGASRWLRLQSQEEYLHAMKLLDFLLARDHEVQLRTIEAPESKFASLLDVFERGLEQEQEVSRQIDALYEIAFNEKAFAAVAELQWFLTEQVEEEKAAREIVAKLKMTGHDPASLLDMDRELGARTGVDVPPAV
jgi:ferritin